MKAKWSQLLGALMLTVAAVIWGFAFVAQKSVMDYIGPVTSNGLRFLVGGAFLGILLLIRDGSGHSDRKILVRRGRHLVPDLTKSELLAGVICGIFLFVATTAQQYGIQLGDVGSSAFITALYIVIVPVLGTLSGRRAGYHVWIGVGVALLGAYLLSVVGGSAAAGEISSLGDFFRAIGSARFAVGRADLLVFLCAVVFSFHIMTIDRFSGRVDGVRLSMLQFFVAGLLSLPVMFLTETPQLSGIIDGILPMLYLGVLSCGVGYTLQILGQGHVEPSIASVIMSLESVFGALGGALILGERMNPAELVGCILVFSAVLLAQIQPKKERL